jgi:2-polyprenyl-3-methyl-5-hydroxy-6-metoxy-1,4-benzoquinol methylase
MSLSYRDRIYEKYASHFKNESSRFDASAAEHWARPYATYLSGWLPQDPSAAILDLACGNGRLLHYFQRQGYSRLSGVDISTEQVALARQVTPDVEEANVLAFLDAHPGQYDLITALDLIEHLGKDEVLQFLDGCYRALRPGGRLILQTPNGDSPFVGTIRYGDFTHELCFTPALLGRLMGLCGFRRFEAREQGPVPLGVLSGVRFVLWKLVRLSFVAESMIETGSTGSRITTRVFIASAVRA